MKAHLLEPQDFPVELMVLRTDTDEPVWGVTLLKPKAGTLTPLYVPPVASWVGVPVVVRTTLNGQAPTITVWTPLRPQG